MREARRQQTKSKQDVTARDVRAFSRADLEAGIRKPRQQPERSSDAVNSGAISIGPYCKSNRKTRACLEKEQAALIPGIGQKKIANLLDLSVIFCYTWHPPDLGEKRKMGGSPIFCL
jgi:hypothetical protein